MRNWKRAVLILAAAILVTIVLVSMLGCPPKTFRRPLDMDSMKSGWFDAGRQTGEAEGAMVEQEKYDRAQAHADARSWDFLIKFGWTCAVPGVIALVIGVWVPMLRSTGVILLIVGLGAGLLPHVTVRYGQVLMIPTAILIVVCFAAGAAWVVLQVVLAIKVKLHTHQLDQKAKATLCPNEQSSYVAAATALKRTFDPAFEAAGKWAPPGGPPVSSGWGLNPAELRIS